MPITARAYAKINLGLYIGPLRASGFHELRTVYQTIALHDTVRVAVGGGTGIEIRCKHPGVPLDESNTCWRIAERVMKTLKQRGKVTIQIEKKLPVQSGLGAASSDAVATLLALERTLQTPLAPEDKLAIAAEVGSDLPLFLVGGTVAGLGRGEEVLPLPDLPEIPLVVATPETGVSTPRAFAEWDALVAAQGAALTGENGAARMNMFSRSVFTWLTGSLTGVPAKGRDRVENVTSERGKAVRSGGPELTPLLDLVRAGIENDFERVVFPQYPELREVKRVLEREGAKYASLSGSGSALYGLFETPEGAEQASAKLNAQGVPAQATSMLSRCAYWKQMFGD